MADEHEFTDENDHGERREHTCTMFLIDQLYVHKLISAQHHFVGVQLLTMRKMFLNPVAIKIGMLKVEHEDGEAPKEIPMRDSDYLQVMRRIKNIAYAHLLREICDEEADPTRYYQLGSKYHLGAVFDALVSADEAHMEDRKQEFEHANKSSVQNNACK